MSKKGLIAIVAAAVLVFVTAYAASPLLAARSLYDAARSGDADKLQRLVDFPAVRESLKGQLNAMMLQSIQSDPAMVDNPFAGLAALMAPAIVNQVIDNYVTAEGLHALMAGDAPTSAGVGAASSRPPKVGKAESSDEAAPKFQHAYRGLDTYVISSVDRADPNARFGFVLHRQGLFGWRLTRLELPTTLMKGEAAKPEVPAEAPQPTARADFVASLPQVQVLLDRWTQENEACRGGSGEEAETNAACDARGRTDVELKASGWCYGENAAYGFQNEWRPCGSPKYVSEAEAEEAAQAGR